MYEFLVFVKKDFLEGVDDMKEFFIVFGEVVGVENKNVVEVIFGKVIVFCIVRYLKNLMFFL